LKGFTPLYITYPPDPLPLIREGGSISKRGGFAPSLKSLPLPFIKGKGIKGIGLPNKTLKGVRMIKIKMRSRL